MRKRLVLGVLCSFGLFPILSAHAHRVNVFAWEENGRIYVEAKFSNGKPVKNARAILSQDSSVLGQSKTNENGVASFASVQGEGTIVRVEAGEGHLGETTLFGVSHKTPTRDKDLEGRVVLEREQYEALLSRARPKGPGLVEIVGGMGWIIGLAGLISYWRSRKND